MLEDLVVKASCCRGFEGSDVGAWKILHLRHGVHHKEIGSHGGPIQLSDGGDPGFFADACDIKLQAVSQLKPKRFGNVLLDAERIRIFWGPSATHQAVVLWQLGAVGQIELPVHHPLGLLVREIVAGDRTVIDLNQSTSNHRVPIELRDPKAL